MQWNRCTYDEYQAVLSFLWRAAQMWLLSVEYRSENRLAKERARGCQQGTKFSTYMYSTRSIEARPRLPARVYQSAISNSSSPGLASRSR